GTEEVLRQGKLSAPKLTELCGAGALDPARESELLRGAADEPLALVKQRCRRSRATSAQRDPMATMRKIHADRYFNSWTDAEGAFCFQGRDTAERGARILNHLRHVADCLLKERTASQGDGRGEDRGPVVDPARDDEPDHITQRALWADAFYTLMTQRVGDATSPGDPAAPGAAAAPGDPAVSSDRSAPSDTSRRSRRQRGSPAPPAVDPDDPRPPPSSDSLSIVTRPPDCTAIVRVELAALLRGTAEPGEICEIDGQGPIPVELARGLLTDSNLTILFHEAGDIRAVSHLGRTINATLRTALVYRDRTCVVPGCGVGVGLEIDHVHEFHLGGPTQLDNLALLCRHHHRLKTYEGWVLTRLGVDGDGQTRWSFEPQAPFGQEPDLGIDSGGNGHGRRGRTE
ncbi:MAG TPA: HNH endonuclease signature motif containing protein, partial [Acidimicrobiales bacterium]|nr:HNH endonuclease signature motif containing protein [Acidimicrobiales bacterium]